MLPIHSLPQKTVHTGHHNCLTKSMAMPWTKENPTVFLRLLSSAFNHTL